MSRMATRLRNASFAMLLGLCASSAFAQSPAEFINDASAKGMADIEASRLAHQKTESKEVKDYTIVVINDRTTANQHLAKIAKQLDLPVAPREEVVDKAKALMPQVQDGASFDQAYAASQVKRKPSNSFNRQRRPPTCLKSKPSPKKRCPNCRTTCKWPRRCKPVANPRSTRVTSGHPR
jgi:putative membrane protein